ncbi:MAG: Xaa-Pro peptidase family protein [Acetobacteraceae bacterium]|nr:Xaa-Pro peptidase family protein [Acetobacteraceae bacterium]
MKSSASAPTFSRGQSQADWERRIDFAALRAGRVEAVRRALGERGLDAAFLWRDENVRYLTSLRAIMLQFRACTTYGVFLHREGQPVVFVSSGDLVRAREGMDWIQEFHPIPILDEPGLVDRAVKEKVLPVFERHGVARGRVAVDALSFLQRQALDRHLPGVEWADGDSLLNRVRGVKLPEELAVLEEVTALADSVLLEAIKAVAPGARECEVAGEALRVLFRLGGELSHTASPFVASGERMCPPTRFSTDKLIRWGDLVFIDVGAYWSGYFADVGRTVICGRPSPEQKRVYRAVYEALQAGIEAIRPGVRCSEVARAIRDRARAHGLGDRFIDLFIGHGVGCAPAESPFLGETMPGAEDVVLEPNMVLALEPLIWIPGVPGGAGVRLEDMVAVTESGCRVMSRLPFDERLLS